MSKNDETMLITLIKFTKNRNCEYIDYIYAKNADFQKKCSLELKSKVLQMIQSLSVWLLEIFFFDYNAALIYEIYE